MPAFSIGLLRDAKSIPTAKSIYNPDLRNNGNATFGLQPANALYCGGAGHIHAILLDGKTTLIFTTMAAGVWHGMPPFVHLTSGTTATDVIVGVTQS